MPMPEVVGVSAAMAQGANVSITPAFPAGYTVVADDIGITYLETASESIGAPSGWTQVAAISVSSGTVTRLAAYWRRLVPGDVAPAYTGTTNHKMGRMIVVRGCRTSGGVAGEPYEFGSASSETVSDTTVSIPGVTTTIANQLVLGAFSTGQDIGSTAGATGWAASGLTNVVERMDNWGANGDGGGFAMASGERAAAGATGNFTATITSPVVANFKAHILITLVGTLGLPPLVLAPHKSR